MQDRKSLIMLISAMTIFGTIGIFRRYIPISSEMLAMLRGLIGMLSLLIILKLHKGKISFPAIRKNLKVLLLSGIFVGFNWMFLFEAYNYTTIAIATLCYYMAPIFLLILAPFFLGEHLTRRNVVCVLVALVGMAFVSGIFYPSELGLGVNLKGILFGLAAAICYAGLIITNKKIEGISAYDKTIVQLGVAAVVLFPYVLYADKGFGSEPLSLSVVLLIILVGVLHTGIAYRLYFGSMDGLRAQTVAIFGYIDPLVAIVLSAVILHEQLGFFEIMGGACILLGTLINEMPSRRES